jgi:DNA-binding transcriptional regulator LsrR (DeoR family)
MPSQTDIADALGLTRQRVSVLVKKGMPIDSVEAAVAWRQAQDDARVRRAPIAAPAQLDDGTLADTIAEHRRLVGRARGVWLGAMDSGDPNQGKYQTAYNQSLKTLVNLEEEQERRLILAKEYISSKEASEAMRQMTGEVVNRLDKLALDVAESCNPENPAKAVKAIEAWVRKTKADLSANDEG